MIITATCRQRVLTGRCRFVGGCTLSNTATALKRAKGFAMQDEAKNVARPAQQGIYYNADVIYLLP